MFQPKASPPFWLKCNNNEKEAILDFLEQEHALQNIGKKFSEISFFSKNDFVLYKNNTNNAIVDNKIESGNLNDKIFMFPKHLYFDHDFEFLRSLREKVLIQNENQFIEIENIKIPYKPFLAWCYELTKKSQSFWQNICPRNLKMLDDCQTHSDWMIGARIFDFVEGWYNNSVFRDKVFDKISEIQIQLFNFSKIILNGSKEKLEGEIIFPSKNQKILPRQIAVIPTAEPEYLEAALSGAGVITENGGTLAHLVNVCRERNVTVIRIEDALTRFKENDWISIDL